MTDLSATQASVQPAVGARIAFRKTLTVAEQAMFTGISGNLGPLYVDRVRARAAGAADMVAFELVVASLATTCIARLCGPDWRIARLDLDFARAVPVGTTIEAAAEIVEAGPERLHLALACTAHGEGAVVGGRAELARVEPARV